MYIYLALPCHNNQDKIVHEDYGNVSIFTVMITKIRSVGINFSCHIFIIGIYIHYVCSLQDLHDNLPTSRPTQCIPLHIS